MTVENLKQEELRFEEHKTNLEHRVKQLEKDLQVEVQRIIAEKGIGVLLVEQHLQFVRQADRYYAMQRGSIVSSGPTSSREVLVELNYLASASLLSSFLHFYLLQLYGS